VRNLAIAEVDRNDDTVAAIWEKNDDPRWEYVRTDDDVTKTSIRGPPVACHVCFASYCS